MIMLRKVKSLPLSTDIGGFLSISNKFDLGISHRSNSSFSANTSLLNQSIKTNEFFLRFKFEKNEKEMTLVRISKSFDIGYAYDIALWILTRYYRYLQ